MKVRRAQIQLTGCDYKPHSAVSGWLIGDSGLAITESVESVYKGWRITHVASGAALLPIFKERRVAKIVALSLASACDWTKFDVENEKDRETVGRIVNTAMANWRGILGADCECR